jgi:hypothetical protein
MLDILAHTCEYAAELAEDDGVYRAHLYAMYLLAQFRTTDACPLVYSLLTQPSDILDKLLGDVLTEGLPGILASICGGDTGFLKRIIENQQLDRYVRGAAMRSLVTIVARGIKPRGEIIEYFQSLFREKLERSYSHVWNVLVSCSYDLYPEELVTDIEQAYDDGLVESFFISLEGVQDRLRETRETVLEQLRTNRHYRLIDATIGELESWTCFKKDRAAEKTDWSAMPATVRVGPKIGRNDPGPCGSGKKYKKCCGRDV